VKNANWNEQQTRDFFAICKCKKTGA
jgi:hypothetical protein